MVHEGMLTMMTELLIVYGFFNFKTGYFSEMNLCTVSALYLDPTLPSLALTSKDFFTPRQNFFGRLRIYSYLQTMSVLQSKMEKQHSCTFKHLLKLL
jgi:hypothetical protein